MGIPENLILYSECGTLRTLLVLARSFDSPSRGDYYPAVFFSFMVSLSSSDFFSRVLRDVATIKRLWFHGVKVAN